MKKKFDFLSFGDKEYLNAHGNLFQWIWDEIEAYFERMEYPCSVQILLKSFLQ